MPPFIAIASLISVVLLTTMGASAASAPRASRATIEYYRAPYVCPKIGKQSVQTSTVTLASSMGLKCDYAKVSCTYSLTDGTRAASSATTCPNKAPANTACDYACPRVDGSAHVLYSIISTTKEKKTECNYEGNRGTIFFCPYVSGTIAPNSGADCAQTLPVVCGSA